MMKHMSRMPAEMREPKPEVRKSPGKDKPPPTAQQVLYRTIRKKAKAAKY